METSKGAMETSKGTEEQQLYPKPPRSRRRKCLICCAVASAIILLVIIILIILAVTLLKPKTPKISVDDVQLQAFNISLNLLNPRISLGFSMRVSVKNPNPASFRYSNTTSRILYHGDQVGQADIPAGSIGAHGSTNFRTNVTIEALQLAGNPNLVPDITNGSVPIVTLTSVSGRVNVLNIIKRHATSSSTCSVTISVASRSVQDYKCVQKTKL